MKINSERPSLDQIWENSRFSKQGLHEVKNKFRMRLLSGEVFDEEFFGLTPAEFDERFDFHFEEIDRLVSINILAYMEALFRVDYFHRVNKRLKDELSKGFKGLEKTYQERVPLEEILEKWKELDSKNRAVISEFIGAMKFRNWLAHGRYWNPKLGRTYDSRILYELALAIHAELDVKDIQGTA